MKTIGLAVDIDETLSWTLKYWVEKMAEKFGNPENLSVLEIIKKYRYSQNVPYWQTPQAEEWMETHRNSNEIQEILPLIEDSNHYLNKIDAIVPVRMYLTIRPQVVVDGTRKWLKQHGFPEAEIVARPNHISNKDGNIWKAKFLEEKYPYISGIIDDNPSVVTNLSKRYEGVVFLYDIKDFTPDERKIIACPDWKSVYENVKEYFKDV